MVNDGRIHKSLLQKIFCLTGALLLFILSVSGLVGCFWFALACVAKGVCTPGVIVAMLGVLGFTVGGACSQRLIPEMWKQLVERKVKRYEV